MNKPLVLFVCTGNSARSQMAEALLRKHAGDRCEVQSAGTEPKGVNPLTVRVMNEIGVNMDGHRSKNLSEFLGRVRVRYIIVVCGDAEQKCPRIWPFGGERLFWPFDDPAAATGSEEERLERFREIRDQINEKVQRWLAEEAELD